jgi:poly-gamma-glutamate synthesis protein (capsule biosynthesis protein)
LLALAGDAMLGRRVAAELDGARRPALLSAELEAAVREADLFVLNLECCISSRGTRWPAPEKPFFFRAPPQAAEFLAAIGVDCVTLANNHALDFGAEALLDTIEHLARVGILAAGAGPDLAAARAPAVIGSGGFRLAVVGVTDHPVGFAADGERVGVAYADLRGGEVPVWLLETLASAGTVANAVLLSPHWGPNLTARPPDHVRAAAAALRSHATLIAGHSAHVFHGVQTNVLYDLGDFVNDYVSIRPSRNLLAGIIDKLGKEFGGLRSEAAVALRSRAAGAAARPELSFWQQQQVRMRRIARMIRARTMRPDLGLLFLVTLDRHGPRRLEALPLKIGHCRTELAAGTEAAFVHRRFRRACAALGTPVEIRGGRATIVWR